MPSRPQHTRELSRRVKTLHTEIEIEASAERVWGILTAFPGYPNWNPFIPRIVGPLLVGARLEVRIEPPGGMAATLRPRLIAADPGRELRWLGHLVIPGLFDGNHRFMIAPLGPDRVRLIQEERFGGILVPLFATELDRHTRAGFEAMNRALKEQAERPDRVD